MSFTFLFFINSILLGVGLAMDAFSVSAVAGLREPAMPAGRRSLIAGTFGFFQFFMPMIGWFCVHTIVEYFRIFEKFIPWIALGLLLWIGGGMLREGLAEMSSDSAASGVSAGSAASGVSTDSAASAPVLTPATLLLQGIATSIDALSVGFTIAEYSAVQAFVSALIIAVVTFFICLGGIRLGEAFGTRLSGKSSILGGLVLIAIGLEIFITGTVLK